MQLRRAIATWTHAAQSDTEIALPKPPRASFEFEIQATRHNIVHESRAQKLKRLSWVYATTLQNVPTGHSPETWDAFLADDLERVMNDTPSKLSIQMLGVCKNCRITMEVDSSVGVWVCSRCARTEPMRGYIPQNLNEWSGAESSEQPTSVMPLVSASAMTNTARACADDWIQNSQARENVAIPFHVLVTVMKFVYDHKLSPWTFFAQAIVDEVNARGYFTSATDAIDRLSERCGISKAAVFSALEETRQVVVRYALQHSQSGMTDEMKRTMKKYYQHSAKITMLLTGLVPPRMNPLQESFLRNLFAQAEPIYEATLEEEKANALPNERKTYGHGKAYVLHVLLFTLGWDEFCALFPLPKANIEDREALRAKVWKNLGWDFCRLRTSPDDPLPTPVLFNGVRVPYSDSMFWNKKLEDDIAFKNKFNERVKRRAKRAKVGSDSDDSL